MARRGAAFPLENFRLASSIPLRNTPLDPTFLISHVDFRSPRHAHFIDYKRKRHERACGISFAGKVAAVCQAVLVLIFTPSSPKW